jgi:hypothetical protein
MFIQVLQGRVLDPDAVAAQEDRWMAELAPGAEGWLGTTSGITDDGRFIAVVRFESAAAARRNSDRPEQDAWWSELSPHLGDVAFHDSARVHVYREGGSDDAGFVQVIQGHTDDMERLAEVALAEELGLAERAPHILGMTVAEHADTPGDFTQTVYFTSEADARQFEREHPAGSDSGFAAVFALLRDLSYHDLRTPRLDSPG